MQKGKLVASGSYEELLRRCAPFRAMVDARRHESAESAEAYAGLSM